MRKLRFIIFTLLILVVTFTFVKSTFACELSIISDKSEVFVGEEISVTIERVKTHKTCVLPIEETKIEVINGEIVKEGEWIKGTKDTKEIVVKFNVPGTGIIKVTRDCPKGGLIVETKEFTVLENKIEETPKEETTTNPPSTIPTNEPNNQSTNENTSQPSSDNTNSDNPNKEQISENVSNTNNKDTSNDPTPSNNTQENNSIDKEEEIINNKTDEKNSENLDKTNSTSKELQNYLFNPQTLLYIILIILSLIFVSLKLYKLRFFTLLFSLALLGFYFGGCICPTSYIGKLFSVEFLSISFYIFLGLIIFISIITLFKGRVFCGWVCPHGALQEFVYKVKTKRFEKVEKYLKYIKYIVLAIVLTLSFIYSQNYFCEVYPFKVLYNFSGTGFILAFAILILFLSIFIYRPFCRFICPFGAYLGLVSKLGEKLGLNKNVITTNCIRCKKCTKECCANSISEIDGCYSIDKSECFDCGECEDNCPKNK